MSKTLKLTCLQTNINTGTQHFPVYVGFKPAKELFEASYAPTFEPDATNAEIAASVGPHTTKWQRPLDEDRVENIANMFREAQGDEEGEIMPNPVLLAVADHVEQDVSLKISNGVSHITIPYKRKAPLWILDGQHRIAGLGQSGQQENDLPFVLLMNNPEEAPVYFPGTYAKLFAQVTTESVPLSRIHQEWLSAAFELNAYSPTASSHRARRRAMKVAQNLCAEKPRLRNRILFKPEAREKEYELPFAWPDYEWVNLLQDDYFKRASKPLSSGDLASAVNKSLTALTQAIPNPKESALLGDNPQTDSTAYGRKPVQLGVMSAILRFIASDPKRGALTVPQWSSAFDAMGVPKSDWARFKEIGTSGAEANRAPKIICDAFLDGLENGGFTNSATFSDWIFGNAAPVLSYRLLTVNSAGEPDDSSDVPHDVELLGGIEKVSVDGTDPSRVFLEMKVSSNLASFVLTDENAPPTAPALHGTTVDRRKVIPDMRWRLEGDKKKKLRVMSRLYGGELRGVELDITL